MQLRGDLGDLVEVFDVGRLGDLDHDERGVDLVALAQLGEGGGYVNLVQVERRYVDRDGKRAYALGVPGSQLCADGLPDVEVELADKAAAFEHAYVVKGWDDAVGGVVPARERLETDDLAGVEAALGLQVEGELVLR